MTAHIDTPRFGYGSRIDGYEVIDLSTGRAVGVRVYDTVQEANGGAQRLNSALLAGPKALARALGATDNPLPADYVGSGRRR